MTWAAPRLALPARWTSGLAGAFERDVLPAYVPACRWFGGKGRAAHALRIVQRAPIAAEANPAQLLAIEVAFTDGPAETYLLPIAFVEEGVASELQESAPLAVLAFLDGGAACDALHLPAARAELLRLMLAPPRASGLAGSASERLDRAGFAAALADTRLLGADQSNTSIACGDAWFFKFYRRFERGPHPDVEITRFLSEEKKLASAVPFGGFIEWLDPAGAGAVGMLTGFTPNRGDGWHCALDAIARYFHRILANPSATTATAFIGDAYLARVRQLATRTAEVHLALADGAGFPDFTPEPCTMAYQRSLCETMRAAADGVFRQLRQHVAQIPEAAMLLEGARELDRAFAHLLDHEIETTRIRIHGDFHLGQVLDAGTDFVIIDFEGEPRLTLNERRLKHSALRDVAGMLRSFDYAGAVALREARADDVPRFEPWARAWVETISASYIAAYLDAVAGSPILPAQPGDTSLLLDLFQLHKAIYEIGYELSYRPEMAPIPIRAARRLLTHLVPH